MGAGVGSSVESSRTARAAEAVGDPRGMEVCSVRACKLGNVEQVESVRMCLVPRGMATHWMGPRLVSKSTYKKVRLNGIGLVKRAVGKESNGGQGGLGVMEGV